MTLQAHRICRKAITPPPGAPEGVDLMFFVASSEAEDSHGDVIKQDGWKLERFKRNPVFLAQHNSWSAPVGVTPFCEVVTDPAWLKEQGVKGPSALVIGVEWDVADEHAARLKGKYDRGIMSAVSVGLIPLEYTPIKGTYGYTIEEAELLEVSAVTIGSNPEATAVRSMGGRHWADADTSDDDLDARALLRLAKRGLLTVRTDVPSTPTGESEGGQPEQGEVEAPTEAHDTDSTDAGEVAQRSADTTPEPSEPIVLRLIQTTGETA